MFKEALYKAFDDMFEHLGQEVQFQPHNASTTTTIIAVVKEPENLYDLGATTTKVDQVAQVTVKTSDITPEKNDVIIIGSRRYKIYEHPLLDASTYMWKFHAIFVGTE